MEMVTRATEISWGNLTILAIFMLILIGLGLYMNRRVRSSDDYWIGGRQVGPVATALSYCAAYYSTVAIIGTPSMVYRYGMAYNAFNVLGATTLTGTLIFIVLALKMRVVSERANAVSLPGFLAVRFESQAIRLISALIIAVMMVPYGVAVLKGIADAFEVLVGIPYKTGVVILAIVTMLYLVSSGYWGMAMTDIIQGLMIAIGGILLAVIVLIRCGGLTALMSGVATQYPVMAEIPGPFPNMWALISTACVWNFIGFGQPQLITKFFALKDSRTIGTIIKLSAAWIGTFLFACGILGYGARLLYGDAMVSTPDVVAPVLAFSTKNILVQGLFLCGVVAAGLSTLAALALSSSVAVTRDIIQDYVLASSGKTLDDKTSIKISRIITVVILLVTLYFTLNPADFVWELSTAAAATMGSAYIASIFIGLYWKKSTKAGAITSTITGAVITYGWYAFNLSNIVHPFLPGMVAAIIVFVAVSLCTAPPSQDTIDMFFKKDYTKRDASAKATPAQA